jgi:hypothetical protein
MNILQQSALVWKELTEYRYQFVYGYKKMLYPINLSFSFEEPTPSWFPKRIALSNPIIVSMAPSIFSVDFSLSALIFPAGPVRIKML